MGGPDPSPCCPSAKALQKSLASEGVAVRRRGRSPPGPAVGRKTEEALGLDTELRRLETGLLETGCRTGHEGSVLGIPGGEPRPRAPSEDRAPCGCHVWELRCMSHALPRG